MAGASACIPVLLHCVEGRCFVQYHLSGLRSNLSKKTLNLKTCYSWLPRTWSPGKSYMQRPSTQCKRTGMQALAPAIRPSTTRGGTDPLRTVKNLTTPEVPLVLTRLKQYWSHHTWGATSAYTLNNNIDLTKPEVPLVLTRLITILISPHLRCH
jgi:hypothetical protein